LKSKFFQYFTPSIIILIDLISKKLVKSSFQIGESKNILGSFLKFSFVENAGIAFGIFSDIAHTSILKNVVFTIITLSAVAFIIFLIRQGNRPLYRTSLYFILGGALGNILERLFGNIIYYGKFELFYGRVVDFIDIGFGNYRWFFFNIADSFITVGVILLIIYTFFFENKKKLKA